MASLVALALIVAEFNALIQTNTAELALTLLIFD